MVVRAVVDRKLTLLDTYVGYLEELAAIGASVFMADFVACGAARYYLQAAIESCADLGAHILASDTTERAEDYRSIFRLLASAGMLPEDLAAPMESAAGLRNRLVHAYDRVDDLRVHEMLRTAPPILRGFARAIAQYLERSP